MLEGDFLIKGGWEEELGETGSECVKDETRWETQQVSFGEDAGSTTEIFSAIWRCLLFDLFFLRPMLLQLLDAALDTIELWWPWLGELVPTFKNSGSESQGL